MKTINQIKNDLKEFHPLEIDCEGGIGLHFNFEDIPENTVKGKRFGAYLKDLGPKAWCLSDKGVLIFPVN